MNTVKLNYKHKDRQGEIRTTMDSGSELSAPNAGLSSRAALLAELLDGYE